jgi:excisionase family DNA binding protein
VTFALPDRGLLTVREVAAAMRVSTMTVYRLIKAGEMRAIRVGEHFRIRESDLAAYLDSRVVGSSEGERQGGRRSQGEHRDADDRGSSWPGA